MRMRLERRTLGLVSVSSVLLGLSPLVWALSLSSTLPHMDRVVLVKVGGSSITIKDTRETINEAQVQWVAQTLAETISPVFKAVAHDDEVTCHHNNNDNPSVAVVLIHGAGSFGHHHAKQYGLSGKNEPFDVSSSTTTTATTTNTATETASVNTIHREEMEGLAKTRLSVQTLNRLLVQALVDVGVNAVGLSPCFATPSLRADGMSPAAAQELRQVVADTLRAGLVPVLHGDACLHGPSTAGILSGDTLFRMLGPFCDYGVFWTDVDGVYTADPKVDPEATLVASLGVAANDNHTVAIDASGSLHPQDVTGGFVTKLAAAIAVARGGTNVTIARCGSSSAKRALRDGGASVDEGSTLIFQK